jgi:hypothetical protein
MGVNHCSEDISGTVGVHFYSVPRREEFDIHSRLVAQGLFPQEAGWGLPGDTPMRGMHKKMSSPAILKYNEAFHEHRDDPHP